MNREEFQKAVSNRFSNTDSGFGNMTQRELILLHIASNIYHEQINLKELLTDEDTIVFERKGSILGASGYTHPNI